MTDTASPLDQQPDRQADLAAALDRAAKLERRLDAVQALLAEERAQAARTPDGAGHGTEFEEAAALRDELAAVRARLQAVQKELAAVRASSTWRAGLVVRRAAAPAAAVRRRAARVARRLRGRGGRPGGSGT
jgi:hypothetical protein